MKRILYILMLMVALVACDKEPSGGSGSGGGEQVALGEPRAWDGVRRGEVVYEIFVRSFADSNGDGIGDLNGISAKLDYLVDFGATAIWLTPIMPSPSYHGYDVSRYSDVNPDFGTMADFEALVQEASAKGIKIILDLVINHSSDQHPWFVGALKSQTEVTRDYYSFAPATNVEAMCIGGQVAMVDDNKYNSGSWHGAADGAMYYGAFSPVMPDFNYGRVPNLNPVYGRMLNIAKFWIDKGVSGLRLDAVKHIYQNERGVENIKFLKQFYTDVSSIYPNVYMIGEVLSGVDDTAPFFAGLPALFNFDSWWKLKEALNKGIGRWYARDMAAAAAKFRAVNANYIQGTKLSNHDEWRTMEDLGKNGSKAALAAAVLMTMPGQPYVYYGEEIGMLGTQIYGDQGVRDPMVWGDRFTPSWRQTYFPPQTVVQQSADPASLLNFYRRMVRLRNTYPALATGELSSPEPSVLPDPLMVYTRRVAGGEALTVVVNVSDRPTSYVSSELNGRPIVSYNGAAVVRTGDILSAALPAYSLLIIEK